MQQLPTKLRIFVDLSPPPDALHMLEAAIQGHELLFSQTPATSVLALAPTDPQLATAQIAFGQPDPAAIVQAPHLQWIQISSSGITRYDNPQFRALMAERKIVVTNSASVFNEYCATHVLSFMLANARRLPQCLNSNIAYATPPWNDLRNACVPLAGQSVLILGYGAIGRRLAELLAPFHMDVRAYRRRPRGDETVPIVLTEQLPAALRSADHIINILPDSSETRHFFDAARFGQCKPGSIFYNIGRGTTVDQAALLQALRSGTLASAWLDVTDPEPLPADHPLLSQPNCFITPHIAGGHTNEVGSLVQHFIHNFRRFLHGEPLLDRVM